MENIIKGEFNKNIQNISRIWPPYTVFVVPLLSGGKMFNLRHHCSRC